jgi:type I restriction-modification system DNA methylase subunit
MWELAKMHGYTDGAILEPSVGVGHFFEYAPKNATLVGYETNPISAQICQLLYPDAKIVVGEFEKRFIKNNDTVKAKVPVEKFELVIGNPPYGEMGGIYAGMGEKSYTKADNYVDYFLTRGLDCLYKDGLLIMIIGTALGTPFLGQNYSKVKEMIAEKADLIDAYRLPNGVFDRTDVVSDIVVFRKKI